MNIRRMVTRGRTRPLHRYAVPLPRFAGEEFGRFGVYPLIRSIVAPQAPSLSSIRSKPRSRW